MVKLSVRFFMIKTPGGIENLKGKHGLCLYIYNASQSSLSSKCIFSHIIYVETILFDLFSEVFIVSFFANDRKKTLTGL